MKKLLVACAVILSLNIFQGVHDTTAQSPDPVYPDEICFPDVPGITDCIQPQVAEWYLQSPVGRDFGKHMDLKDAIQLWGYPLTDLHWERNADGDCVLTQWFERAVFEFHEPGAGWVGLLTLRRLGAELHGDALYEPQTCLAGED